jgi:predicted Ser/Thr protein kinase
MPSDVLTVASVTDLLKRCRNRTVQYLCRAYLQFGPENMDAESIEKLRKAIEKGAK